MRTLVQLSRLGSFAAVAEHVNLSVPSVWNQIRALEENFGVPLVVTSSRGVTLTEEGQLLVERAIPLVKGFDDLIRNFPNEAGRLQRKLAVATTASLLANELLQPLSSFRERLPEVEISFLDQPSLVSGRMFRDGHADVAVIGRLESDRETWTSGEFEIRTLTRYPFMLVASEGHPLLKRPRLGPKTLAGEPLIIPAEGSNARRGVEHVFVRHGLLDSLHVVLGASHFELLAGHVRQGFGVSITSISPLVLEQAGSGDPRFGGLGFRDLSGTFGHEEVVCIRRVKRHYSPHEQAFWEIIGGKAAG